MINNENIRNNRLLIDIIKTECDDILHSIEESAFAIANEERIRSLAREYPVLDDRNRYELGMIKNVLARYKNSFGRVDDYYLWFSHFDKAVSPDEIIETSELYNKNNFNIPLAAWKDLISKDTGNKLAQIPVKNGENKYIYVLRTFYTNQFGVSNVSLICILDDHNFGFINDGKIAGMSFFIKKLDEITQIYGYFDVDINSFDSEFENGVFKKIGNDYLYSACNSEQWNIQYILVSDTATVFAMLDGLKYVYFIVSALALVLGLSLAYFFARGNYRSIRKISDSLSVYVRENDDISTLKGLSDFTVNMIKNYAKVVNDNASKQEKLQKDFIRKLLHSDYREAEKLVDHMKQNNIEFLSNKFAVMVIQILENVNLFMNYNVIIKLITDICSLKNETTVVEENGFLVCLINFSSGIDGKCLENSIVEMQNSICNVAKSGYYIDMNFASSSVVSGMDKIYIAFIEAMSVMDYKTMSGKKDILFLKDIKEFNDNTGTYYTLEQEKSIIKAIVIGRADLALNIIIEIIKAISADVHLLRIGYKYFSYDIMSSILKGATQIGAEAVNFMIDNNISFEAEMKKAHSSDEYIAVWRKILNDLCNYVNENVNRVKPLEERVMENIYENYTNYDLCLNSIADELNLHPVYLSSSFKSQCGEGISTRIEKIRLEKAFQLLENGESVRSTAEKTGYANVQTFSKAFKRKYGVAPSTITKKI